MGICHNVWLLCTNMATFPVGQLISQKENTHMVISLLLVPSMTMPPLSKLEVVKVAAQLSTNMETSEDTLLNMERETTITKTSSVLVLKMMMFPQSKLCLIDAHHGADLEVSFDFMDIYITIP